MTVCGTVQLNAANVADGTAISAWLDGENRGQTATATHEGDSIYCVDITDSDAWDPITGPPPGQDRTVAFQIDGVAAAQTIAWSSGSFAMLDLTAATSGQQVALSQGWNLISTRIEPAQPAVAQAMVSIDGDYDRILGDGLVYATDVDPVFNTLQEIHAGIGYYLRTNTSLDGTLALQGTTMAADASLPLAAGWNWIGFLPEMPVAVADALQSIDGLYHSVLGMETAYLPGFDDFNTLHDLVPGQGYLIYMNSAGTLTYPAAVTSAMAGPRQVYDLCSDVQPTPFSTLVYGYATYNDEALRVGTRVEALTPDGAVAGCFVVTTAGQYGFMHVYGADESADPPIPGFADGEVISLRVNGVVVEPAEPLTWQDDKSPHQIDLAVEGAVLLDVFLPIIESGTE